MNETLKVLESRRSIRKFKNEPIPQNVLDEVLKAGEYAPTGKNMQSPVIVAITNKELRKKIAEENAKIGGWQEDFDPFYGARRAFGGGEERLLHRRIRRQLRYFKHDERGVGARDRFVLDSQGERRNGKRFRQEIVRVPRDRGRIYRRGARCAGLHRRGDSRSETAQGTPRVFRRLNFDFPPS